MCSKIEVRVRLVAELLDSEYFLLFSVIVELFLTFLCL